jgi:hypothetical protein
MLRLPRDTDVNARGVDKGVLRLYHEWYLHWDERLCLLWVTSGVLKKKGMNSPAKKFLFSVAQYSILSVRLRWANGIIVTTIGKFPKGVCWWLTSWRWTLLEKPPIAQLLKNFPTFYGTRRFITVFTRALHRSLSWARSIQYIPPHSVPLTTHRVVRHRGSHIFSRQLVHRWR